MAVRASGREADLLSLGTYIRHRRTALGLSQEQMASRLGWAQERVSLVENGKYGLPSLPVLAALSDALEVTLISLIAAAGFDAVGGPALDADRSESRTTAVVSDQSSYSQ